MDSNQKFKCKRCGACCRAVGSIAKLLPIQVAEVLMPDVRGVCQYLGYTGDKQYHCRIYKNRPLLCRVDELIAIRSKELNISTAELLAITHDACERLRKDELKG